MPNCALFYKKTLSLILTNDKTKTKMKDQLRLLRTCIYNEIPAVVFQGDDSCAPEILEAAKEIYRRHGCSEEFLYDWQLLIDEVKAYQAENSARVKLPRLQPSEAETVRDEMARREAAG